MDFVIHRDAPESEEMKGFEDSLRRRRILMLSDGFEDEEVDALEFLEFLRNRSLCKLNGQPFFVQDLEFMKTLAREQYDHILKRLPHEKRARILDVKKRRRSAQMFYREYLSATQEDRRLRVRFAFSAATSQADLRRFAKQKL